jgi:hypothetical protein
MWPFGPCAPATPAFESWLRTDFASLDCVTAPERICALPTLLRGSFAAAAYTSCRPARSRLDEGPAKRGALGKHHLMKRISAYFGSGQRSSGTIRSSLSATSRVAAIAGMTTVWT